MASFDYHAPTDRYHIRFRWDKAYKRSLRLPDKKSAKLRCAAIEDFIQDLRLGKQSIPPDVNVGDYILAAGKGFTKTPSVAENEIARPLTLERLWELYGAKVGGRAKESTTNQTEAHHRVHLLRGFGPKFPLADLSLSAAQRYVGIRTSEDWRGKPIGPVTILKEVATLRVLWNWGVKFGHLIGPFPLKLGDLEFERSQDRAPFQTYEQIIRTLARGNLDKKEESALWECLYLTLDEVHEVLGLVKSSATHPFIHPMFALAAYTGARRSEICRAKVEDFDFENRIVTIREKKRKRGRDSFRKVDMSNRLAEAMREWLEGQTGEFAISKDGEPLTVKMATDHFKRVLSRTKWRVIPGFHTLRHSFASMLASKGVDAATIDAWMGHQTEEQRERYRHLYPSSLKRAIELLD